MQECEQHNRIEDGCMKAYLNIADHHRRVDWSSSVAIRQVCERSSGSKGFNQSFAQVINLGQFPGPETNN